MIRWLADRWRGKPASEAETETSSGVLLSSGFIAGGTLMGLVIAFFTFLPKQFNDILNLSPFLGKQWNLEDSPYPKVAALLAFAAAGFDTVVGIGAREPSEDLTELSPTKNRTG